MVCGGKSKHHNVALSKNCISLDPQTLLWSNHSNLSQPRIYASEVTMPNGMVFLVGGWYSERTSEVLMPGSTKWTKGPHLPHPLDSACALPMDDNTFVAIGGGMYHTKVISYNIATSKWNDTWPQLAEGRRGHSCAKLGSNLMVAGGYSYTSFAYSDSTIMIDATTGHKLTSIYPQGTENRLNWLEHQGKLIVSHFKNAIIEICLAYMTFVSLN